MPSAASRSRLSVYLICLGAALLAVGVQGGWPHSHWAVWTAGCVFGAALAEMIRRA